MTGFVALRNIRHFQDLLKAEADSKHRELPLVLFAEEQAKLAGLSQS
jgi:hypothetical protein